MGRNNEDAKRLLAASMGFLLAARAIKGIEGPPVHFPALYTNLYYAVELALKSYLSSRGRSRADLKKLGHKLCATAEAAAVEGFHIRDPLVSEFITRMDGHLFNLRYLETAGMDVAEPDEALQLVAVLVESIAHAIPSTDLH